MVYFFFVLWIVNDTCQYDCSIFSTSASKMRIDFKLELCVFLEPYVFLGGTKLNFGNMFYFE